MDKAKRTAEYKKRFLEILQQRRGNIYLTCQATNINRALIYVWMRQDAEFEKAVREAREVRKDWIESQLDRKIAEGDTTAIIFACKTQCADRGYADKMQIDANTNIQTVPKLPEETILKIASLIEPF